MLPRIEPSRRIRFLSIAVVAAAAVLVLIMSCTPTTVSLVPELKPLFVRVTKGYVFMETPQGQDYMHRFYARSSSLAPMSAPLFEQLEDWKIYRGALQKGTFTVCERTVAGSNAVLWIGYDSKIPLAGPGAWCLVDRNGKKLALSTPENYTLKNTTRHIWSAVCSEAPHPGEQYALRTEDRRILLLTAPK